MQNRSREELLKDAKAWIDFFKDPLSADLDDFLLSEAFAQWDIVQSTMHDININSSRDDLPDEPDDDAYIANTFIVGATDFFKQVGFGEGKFPKNENLEIVLKEAIDKYKINRLFRVDHLLSLIRLMIIELEMEKITLQKNNKPAKVIDWIIDKLNQISDNRLEELSSDVNSPVNYELLNPIHKFIKKLSLSKKLKTNINNLFAQIPSSSGRDFADENLVEPKRYLRPARPFSLDDSIPQILKLNDDENRLYILLGKLAKRENLEEDDFSFIVNNINVFADVIAEKISDLQVSEKDALATLPDYKEFKRILSLSEKLIDYLLNSITVKFFSIGLDNQLKLQRAAREIKDNNLKLDQRILRANRKASDQMVVLYKKIEPFLDEINASANSSEVDIIVNNAFDDAFKIYRKNFFHNDSFGEDKRIERRLFDKIKENVKALRNREDHASSLTNFKYLNSLDKFEKQLTDMSSGLLLSKISASEATHAENALTKDSKSKSIQALRRYITLRKEERLLSNREYGSWATQLISLINSNVVHSATTKISAAEKLMRILDGNAETLTPKEIKSLQQGLLGKIVNNAIKDNLIQFVNGGVELVGHDNGENEQPSHHPSQ